MNEKRVGPEIATGRPVTPAKNTEAANRPADAAVLKRRLADTVRALYAPAN